MASLGSSEKQAFGRSLDTAFLSIDRKCLTERNIDNIVKLNENRVVARLVGQKLNSSPPIKLGRCEDKKNVYDFMNEPTNLKPT